MAEFNKAIPIIMAHEGGFVDDPDDPGGVTNYGLTKRWLIDHHIDLGQGPGIITTKNLRILSVETAQQLYYNHIWKPFGLSFILDQVVATKIFDMIVNMGERQAFHLVRNALIDYRGWELPRYGHLDDKLLEAVNTVQPYRLMPAIIKECVRFYQVLVHVKPRLGKFLPGWLRRANWPPATFYPAPKSNNNPQ